MSHEHPEISDWLMQRGYSPPQIEKILKQLEAFDARANRDSLFEDLASGDFDIGPIIAEALKDETAD